MKEKLEKANEQLAAQKIELSNSAEELSAANQELVIQNEVNEKIGHELAISESALLKAQQIAHCGSWEWDFNSLKVHFSEEACRIAGLGPTDDNKHTLEECLSFLHIEDVEYVTKLVRDSHNATGDVSFDHRIVRKDGTVRYIHSESKFDFNSGGVPVGLHGIAHDITERKNEEFVLRRSEEKFRALYDSTSEAVMLLNEKGFFDCNPATLKIFGCASKEEFCLKHPADLSPPKQPSGEDSVTLANRQIAMAMETGSNNFEWQHQRVDTGQLFYADILLTTITLNDNTVIEAVVRNIDERKNAEKKLLQSEQYHRALIENITDGVVLLNERAQPVYQSPSAERISGFTTEEIKDTTVFELIHPDDRLSCMEFFQRAFANPGVAQHNQYRIRCKDERYISIEGTVINLLNNESVKGFVVNYRDITQRIEDMQKISASESKYRSLIEQASDAIVLAEADGSITEVNTSAEKLFGYTRKNLLSMKLSDLAFASDLKANPVRSAGLEKGTSIIYERRMCRKDNSPVDVEISAGKMDDARVLGIIRDISERKKGEQQIEFNQNNLSALINNTNDLMWSVDLDFNLITANEAFDKMSKINFGGIVERGTNILSTAFTPEMRNHYKLQYERAFAGEAYTETEHFTEPFEFWSQISYYPIRKGDEVIGTACHSRDITVGKKAEREIIDLNENLEQKITERTVELTVANDALEAFSYSVSHDLRSPVRAIIGFAKIINRDYIAGMDEDLKEMFGHIEASGTRMNEIIDGLLTLAKAGKEKLMLEEVDLYTLFKGVWDDLIFPAPNKASFILPQMPVVMVDKCLLQQVVVNLLSNAIKYSAKRKHPQVVVGFESTATTLTVSIEDNGAGFDMKFYDRLFGVFQRLHGTSDFEGTGVGLVLVKRIVERHGGIVWAEGKVDEGAVFYFTLPLAA